MLNSNLSLAVNYFLQIWRALFSVSYDFEKLYVTQRLILYIKRATKNRIGDDRI